MTREPHPIDTILPTMAGISTIAEIGCHRMEDTAFLRQTFPKARIIAFEPDPRNANFIISRELDWRYEIDFLQLAIGDTDEVRDLWLSTNFAQSDADWSRSNSLRQPRTFGDAANVRAGIVPCVFQEQPVRVACRRLDTMIEDIGLTAPIDFIWCDAQGADDLVIQGATDTLKRTRWLLVEHNTGGCYIGEPGLEGIKALLPGWEIVHCWPYDVLLRNPAVPPAA